MTKFGTYMRIDLGMVPSKKKKVPRVVRKGGLIGAILRSGYLAGGQRAIRAVANGRCRGSEPLAKQREEL